MTILLHKYIDTKHYRSILCLNGDLPEREFFTGGLPIIAADGAANKLIAVNIEPDLIIGDLDSVEDHIKSTYKTLHDADQDRCDYQKSLTYLQEANLLPTIVTGISGGSLDHVLNNINFFMQSDSLLYSPPVFGMVIKADEAISLSVAIGTKISLIGLPNACVSTTGLQWELTNYALRFPGKNSCFNRASKRNIKIDNHEGAVLMFVYLEEVNDAGLGISD